MAEPLGNHIYRVSIGSERNYTFIHAKDREDLIRYLAHNHPSETALYGVKELTKDGYLQTVPILDDPLLHKLYTTKGNETSHNRLPPGVAMIDGRPWVVMLPTGGTDSNTPCLWTDAIKTVQNHKAKLHQIDMFSWCQEDLSPTLPHHRILRGFEPCKWLTARGTLRHNALGYRPVLIPLDKTTLEINTSFLLGRPDGSIFRFGTLYMNGEPMLNPTDPTPEGNIPSYIPNAKLSIGDSTQNPLQRIAWIKVGNALIADRNLLKHISWHDIHEQGLALGPNKETLEATVSNAKQRASIHPYAKYQARERA